MQQQTTHDASCRCPDCRARRVSQYAREQAGQPARSTQAFTPPPSTLESGEKGEKGEKVGKGPRIISVIFGVLAYIVLVALATIVGFGGLLIQPVALVVAVVLGRVLYIILKKSVSP